MIDVLYAVCRQACQLLQCFFHAHRDLSERNLFPQESGHGLFICSVEYGACRSAGPQALPCQPQCRELLFIRFFKSQAAQLEQVRRGYARFNAFRIGHRVMRSG